MHSVLEVYELVVISAPLMLKSALLDDDCLFVDCSLLQLLLKAAVLEDDEGKGKWVRASYFLLLKAKLLAHHRDSMRVLV